MIMDDLTLINNEFLRQFEVKIEDSLARIEYSEQERKIFLTKLHTVYYMCFLNYYYVDTVTFDHGHVS